ncbi:MAG: hypothetical protein WAV93_11415 [Bacteroidales bacterium]
MKTRTQAQIDGAIRAATTRAANKAALLAAEQALIAQVAAELDTTPEDAHITITGYTGPMLALRQRLQEGAYKKALNGQPCCGDNVATLLGALAPQQVIRACILAMALPGNPYLGLNLGQQSMNLRNKLRGCFKREEFGFGVLTEAVEQVLEEDAAAKIAGDAK